MEENKKEQELPVLEIKPAEEYHPRPMWQRIGAWIGIGLVLAASCVYFFWGKL